MHMHFLKGVAGIGFAMLTAIHPLNLGQTGGSIRDTSVFYAVAFLILIMIGAFIIVSFRDSAPLPTTVVC